MTSDWDRAQKAYEEEELEKAEEMYEFGIYAQIRDDIISTMVRLMYAYKVFPIRPKLDFYVDLAQKFSLVKFAEANIKDNTDWKPILREKIVEVYNTTRRKQHW